MKRQIFIVFCLLFLSGCSGMGKRVGLLLRSAGEGMEGANRNLARCQSQIVGNQVYTVCR